MTQKLDNLTGEQKANGTPEDKIIEIKSVFSKEAKMKLQPTKDERNGRYKGIETNLSDMEKMKRGYTPEISSSIVIKDGVTFDLNDTQDLADWLWVKHSIHIAKDFDAAQSDPRAWYYVHSPGKESRKKLSEMKEELDILTKIMDDTEQNLFNRVRLLGIDMTGQPLSDVREYLMSAAKNIKRRKSVIDLYESEDISLKLMLYHGLDKEIISYDGFIYKYGNIMLGTTEDLALAYLSNSLNVGVVKEIENSIYPSKGIGKEAPVKKSTVAAKKK
ncbi:MAG: hypothetical protein KAH32_05210 [Chlamydiia bacterium]|nr:hypothetical protein [Chlamydiia bacterium]